MIAKGCQCGGDRCAVPRNTEYPDDHQEMYRVNLDSPPMFGYQSISDYDLTEDDAIRIMAKWVPLIRRGERLAVNIVGVRTGL